MFGMLSPARHTLAYRSTYARCCQHHRRVNGVSALPWLSYEAVLLYQLAADAGAVNAADLPQVRCCKLLPLSARVDDRDFGVFCAHVGSLLASIKVSDDRRDGGSLRSRVLGWLYRQRFAATFAYFSRLDRDFKGRVDGFIREHLLLEDQRSPITLDDYVRPTASAFAYVFALMARLPGLREREDLLRQLGERVGPAIIAFDCAVDRDRDRRRGDFNPLPDGPAAVQEALAFSREQIRRAQTVCEGAFGPNALTAKTLEGVGERVNNVGRRLACPRCGEQVRGALQNWGLAQRPGSVQFNSLFGLAGLAALGVGLAAKLMASAPPPADLPPVDPSTVVGQPPPVAPQPVPPPAVAASGGDCSGAGNCCDATSGCAECGGCAIDSACDGVNCGDCGSGCDCSGCDCSC
jgi:hypothetical protein